MRYVGRRLLYAALTVWLLVSVTFFLMQTLPGKPFIGEKNLPPQVEAALIEKHGLDRPLGERYLTYLKNLAQGDLGTSLISGRRVSDVIATAFPISLELGVRALVFALFFGIFFGVVAALKRGTVWDTLSMLLLLLGISIPSFILGALLQYFFGFVLFQATGVRLFAIMGWGSENSKLLPAFALALGSVAAIGRLMRTSMLEVMGQDYIRTARVKGLGTRRIVLHHCLRNALMPVLGVLGPITAVLLTGTFAVENVFSIPGLGKYFVDSVQSNDYPVIVGTTLFFGVFVVLCNLATDLLAGLLDPRIRLEGVEHA